MKQYALITGASQGLGKSFALELASRGINTILISLPNQNLEILNQKIIETYNVDSQYFETDLSTIENILSLTKFINEHFNVSILINNAGLGGSNIFTEVSASYINKIIQVNVMATSILTHQILPNLLKQPKGYILNVSSMAAFTPFSYKTVYPASKTFVYSFSRGLNEELKDTNVCVSVVNPGAMATNENVSNRIKKLGFLGKFTLLNPDKVAKKSIKQLFKKQNVIIFNNLSWLLLQVLPVWIKLPILTKILKKEIAL